MAELVLQDTSDGIAVLTLNRPEKLNALSYAMVDQIITHIDAIETDDAVRAVILTGAGERAFSAGADIREFSESVKRGTNSVLRDFVRRGQTMTSRIEACTKPVIVAVNGLAYGGGCEITEAAHLAIASDRATFAKPEIALGMPPTFGGTQRLARLAGRKRALSLLLTGEPFSAQDAMSMGLVNRVVAHASLLDGARELTRLIIRHSPLAVGSVITAVTRGINMPIAEGLLVESEQFARVAPTFDLREGLAAWSERRSAHYQGR